MSDFRKRLLLGVALATTFAGASYAQVTCPAGSAVANSAGNLLRVEGQTELVSDITLICAPGADTTGVTVTVNASLPITSKAITPANTFNTNGNSEVVLSVTNTVGPVTTTYSGLATGTLVTFTGVTFPASFVAVLRNVRVNASSSAVGAAVTESIVIGQSGVAQFAQAGILVGQILKGLQAPSFIPVGAVPTLTPNPIAVCAGAPVTNTAAPAPVFTVVAASGFPGAFKLQADTTAPLPVLTNQENGSFVDVGRGIGVASSSTQISLTFANVPATAAIYAPLTVTYTPAGGVPTTLTLATTSTPATAPGGLALIPSVPAGGTPLAGYTYGTSGAVVGQLPAPVAGVVTAIYNVTASSAAQSETFLIPIYMNLPAASPTSPLAVQGPITVLEAFAPTGTLQTSGLAGTTPLFAAPTNTPLNAQAIIGCNTTLLFPFVTNAPGFETGVSIANTTTDNLGAKTTAIPNGASSVNPSVGTCEVNFYGGTAAQPAAFVTPNIGPNSTATPTLGVLYSNTLTAMGPTNFTGYAIAKCNFLDAHGFGYVVQNYGTTSGTAMGYLSVVLPNVRPAAGDGAPAPGAGLGQ